MPNGEITHFEIPADDIDRAKRFYAAVAGWQFAESDGFPGYWMFQTIPNQQGGGLGKRGEAVGSVLRAYLNVASLDAAVAAAEANGGSIVSPAQEIPGMGRWAAVKDSEGNEIGLWENATPG